MEKRYFPIRSETACKLKWSWNTINLQTGKTASCCKAKYVDIDINDFDNFHNYPHNLESRQSMLNGQQPSECNFCWTVEEHNGGSWRKYHNQIPNGYPLELDHNESITVIPTILEVYFTNVCNLKCLYCSDLNSSQIQDENRRFGTFNKNGVVIKSLNTSIPDVEGLTEKFWLWLEKNYKNLQRLQILGGEPFFQKELLQLIDFMEQNENPNLEFEIVSNLATTQERIRKPIERIKTLIASKKIARFEILASIDCWGAEQEYIRSNLDLDLWQKNFEYIAEQKWIVLSFNQVISSLTIFTVPELLGYINQIRQKFNRKIGHQLTPVSYSHSFLDISVLGKRALEDTIQSVYEKMDLSDWQTNQAKILLEGIFSNIIDINPNQIELNKLIVFLDEIDRRRGYNWKQTFPKLLTIMRDHNVV